MHTPEQRINIIENSLGCFWWGLWSLVPFLGIVPAIRSWILFRRTRKLAAGSWNPASVYLRWGIGLAASAITFYTGLVVVVGILIAMNLV